MLARFINLSPLERRLLLRATFLVGAVRLGLSTLSFQTVSRIIERRNERSKAEQRHDEILAERIAWSVRVAARFIPAATCLTQAFSAVTLLREFGQPADLRIGVAKSCDGKLEAHAWVESSGAVVIGNLSDLSRYNVLSPVDNVYPYERNLRHI